MTPCFCLTLKQQATIQRMAGPPGLHGPSVLWLVVEVSSSADAPATASTATARAPLSRPVTATPRNVTNDVSHSALLMELLSEKCTRTCGIKCVCVAHSQTGWWLEPLVSLVLMLCNLWGGVHHSDTPLQLPYTPDGWHGLPGRRTSNGNLPEVTLS